MNNQRTSLWWYPSTKGNQDPSSPKHPASQLIGHPYLFKFTTNIDVVMNDMLHCCFVSFFSICTLNLRSTHHEAVLNHLKGTRSER